MLDDIRQRLVELVDGSYIERDVLNIVEKIAEYDGNLRLKYCPNPNVTDAPYALFEVCLDGMERLVMPVWELDDRLLERVIAADTRRSNVLKALEENNEKEKRVRNRRYDEVREEGKDILEHVFNSPRGKYSFVDPVTDKKITVDDSGPGTYG